MWILGHLGIGRRLARPFLRGLSLKPFFIGALFPDLLDKSMFFSLKYLGIESQFFVGTRSFGHSALALLLVTFFSMIKKSKFGAALALGIATHLLLDHFGVYLESLRLAETLSNEAIEIKRHRELARLFWPLLGNDFPVASTGLFGKVKGFFSRSYLIFGEILGLYFLLGPSLKRKLFKKKI